MLKYAKKCIINSIKHILAEYDEKICFEDRAEFHPSWPYSFLIKKYLVNSEVVQVLVDLTNIKSPGSRQKKKVLILIH